jgi:hypothetical protein
MIRVQHIIINLRLNNCKSHECRSAEKQRCASVGRVGSRALGATGHSTGHWGGEERGQGIVLLQLGAIGKVGRNRGGRQSEE